MGNGHVRGFRNKHVNTLEKPEKLQPQWMKELPGSMYLGEISIPGTHETLAIHGDPICCSAKAQCNSWNIYNQLLSGLRCFDLRVKVKQGELKAYHSIVNMKQTLKQVIEQCYNFLEKYPSEVILWKLKEEGQNINHKESNFEVIFKKEVLELEEQLQKKKDFWFKENRIPKLDEVRGKIFLMRQYYGNEGFIYDQSKNPKLCFQVNWKLEPELLRKVIKLFFKSIKKQQNIGMTRQGKRINLNLFNRMCSLRKNPLDYALEINHVVFEEYGYLGIVLFDFPSCEVIDHVIKQNFLGDGNNNVSINQQVLGNSMYQEEGESSRLIADKD